MNDICTCRHVYQLNVMSKLFDLQDTDLLPQLGGALSLFLGIAIIMAFEIFELIGDLLVALFFQGN